MATVLTCQLIEIKVEITLVSKDKGNVVLQKRLNLVGLLAAQQKDCEVNIAQHI